MGGGYEVKHECSGLGYREPNRPVFRFGFQRTQQNPFSGLGFREPNKPIFRFGFQRTQQNPFSGLGFREPNKTHFQVWVSENPTNRFFRFGFQGSQWTRSVQGCWEGPAWRGAWNTSPSAPASATPTGHRHCSTAQTIATQILYNHRDLVYISNRYNHCSTEQDTHRPCSTAQTITIKVQPLRHGMNHKKAQPL